MSALIDDKRYVLPWTAPIYRSLAGLSYPFLRMSLGVITIPHGYDKLFKGGAANTARNAVLNIFGDPLIGAYFIGGVEFFGGLMLVLGLLTRFAAAAVAIQMFVVAFIVLSPDGWGWTHHGMEYAFFMMLIAIGILMGGAGDYSLDKRLPKEL